MLSSLTHLNCKGDVHPLFQLQRHILPRTLMMNSQTPTTNTASTPLAGKKMSASLKERLRRLRQYHGPDKSPFMACVTMPTRLDDTEPETTEVTPGDSSNHHSTDGMPGTPTLVGEKRVLQRRLNLSTRFMGNRASPGETMQHELLHRAKRPLEAEEDQTSTCKRLLLAPQSERNGVETELKMLKERIKDRQEVLRKLKLVKLYRDKNDLDKLESVIGKWRTVCQEAVQELRDRSTMEPRPSVVQLLDHFQIDHVLVCYDAKEECFY